MMTELIAQHPIKSTLTTAFAVIGSVFWFSWNTSNAYTEINVKLETLIQEKEYQSKCIKEYGERLTKVETILNNWRLDD